MSRRPVRRLRQAGVVALGIDVAGPNGVLAHRNPNVGVLADLRGIDHLEETGILEALLQAAAECEVQTC